MKVFIIIITCQCNHRKLNLDLNASWNAFMCYVISLCFRFNCGFSSRKWVLFTKQQNPILHVDQWEFSLRDNWPIIGLYPDTSNIHERFELKTSVWLYPTKDFYCEIILNSKNEKSIEQSKGNHIKDLLSISRLKQWIHSYDCCRRVQNENKSFCILLLTAFQNHLFFGKTRTTGSVWIEFNIQTKLNICSAPNMKNVIKYFLGFNH